MISILFSARLCAARSLLCFVVFAGVSAISLPAVADDVATNAHAPISVVETDSGNPFGAYSTSIPITVTPFHGVEPKLRLQYDSGARGGFVGVGWTLQGPSAIERASPGGGSPIYGASDVFFLDGKELVASTLLGGTHATKRQTYLRITRDTSLNKWYVWSKDGTKATYDALDASGSNTFRWRLKSVVDTHGNTATYNYASDGTYEWYLDTITYNGTTVRFYRESRADIQTYARGVDEASVRYRLKTISVSVSGSLARAYKFSYATSTQTSLSVLSSVQLFGTDATLDAWGSVTSGTAQPAVSMTSQSGAALGSWTVTNTTTANYITPSASVLVPGDFNGDGKTDFAVYNTGSNWTTTPVYFSNGDGSWRVTNFPSGTWSSDSNVYAGDFNGDGKTDLAMVKPASNWTTTPIYFSNGDGSWRVTNLPSSTWASASGAIVIPGDFDGDGKTDLAMYNPGSNWSTTPVYFSNGDGSWRVTNQPSGSWSSTSGAVVVPGDFNGDGKTDLAVYNPTNSGWLSTPVYFSNGDGTWRATNLASGSWSAESGAHLVSGDFNGDGKTDLAVYKPDSNWQSTPVYFSNGDGSWNVTISASGTWNIVNGMVVMPGDFNGDGRTDLAVYNPTNSGWTTTPVYFSRGDGTWQVTNLASGSWSSSLYVVGIPGDFNGDGKTDLAFDKADGGWSAIPVYMTANSTQPDVLSTITSGQGGPTSISYKPSSAWPNTNLPFVTQTVSQVGVGDGRGNVVATNFIYSGALWSAADRKFLGFRTVRATGPRGHYTESTFRQTFASAGKPERIDQRDVNGSLFAYKTLGYKESASAPLTSLVTDQFSFECNQTSTCRQIRITPSYDTYGNVTQTVEYGDTAITGDERTTTVGFYPNTSSYLVGLPAYKKIFSGTSSGGTLLSASYSYFDNASSYTTPPVVGDVTKTQAWLDTTGGYVETSAIYDAMGNAKSVTDLRGFTSTTGYDTTYNVFPTSQCNALNQCTTAIWDYVLGVKTSTTDVPNNATTGYGHDVFGRPTSQTNPDQGVTTVQYLNDGNPNLQSVRTTSPDGSADGLWKEQYLDGLGRAWRTISEGPTGNSYFQDKQYSNTFLMVLKESLPYASGDTPRWQVFDYDGADRQIKTTHPDSTYSQTVYGKDATGPYTKTVDEVGHEKSTYKDAYSNVAAVAEKDGSSIYTTTYTYTLLNKLHQITDAATPANISTLQWDSLGRKTSTSDMDMGNWSYTYDAGGLPLTQTDAKPQTTTMTYDELGRIKTKLAGGKTTTWYYDEPGYGASIGRLTRITYPGTDGSEAHSYDNMGHETTTQRCVTGTCQTIASTFDQVGRLWTLTYPDSEVLTYTYNPAGDLWTVSGYVTSMTWSPARQLTAMSYSNGTSNTFVYDPNRSWLSNASATKDSTGATLYTATYGYYDDGVVSSMTQGTPATSTINFIYDGLNRLTNVSGAQSQNLVYDAIGNIKSNSTLGTYVYGDTAHKHAVTVAGVNAYAYDANGNMLIGAGGNTYTWDAENRLATRAQTGVTTTFTYGAGEDRIQKVTGTTTTRYFGKQVERINATNTSQYYYAGPILIAKKGALGNKYWYHADRLGSTRVITGSSGFESRDYDYQPYGFIQATSGTLANNRTFTGQIQDEDTGLIYFGARYYNPTLARFISADTVMSDFNNPQTINRYAYALNNPVNNTDPTGHDVPFGCDVNGYDGHGAYDYSFGSGYSAWELSYFNYWSSNSNASNYSATLAASPWGAFLQDIKSGMSLDFTNGADAAAALGAQLGDAGDARELYRLGVSALDPDDSAGRRALKATVRRATPPLLRGLIEASRPGLGPLAGTGGTANSSNPSYNFAGRLLRVGGRVFVVGGLTYDAYSIAEASDPYRELAGRSGGLLFGTLGGVGGALLGTSMAPGPGTIAVGISGAYGGSELGGSVFYDLYDYVRGN